MLMMLLGTCNTFFYNNFVNIFILVFQIQSHKIKAKKLTRTLPIYENLSIVFGKNWIP